MGYRDDREALHARATSLEAEIATLKARDPEALERRVSDLERELRSVRRGDTSAANEGWVAVAYARSRRRAAYRLLAGGPLFMIPIFVAASSWHRLIGLLALPAYFVVLLWAAAPTKQCPKCAARLSRAVQAGRKRRCEACQARLFPSDDA